MSLAEEQCPPEERVQGSTTGAWSDRREQYDPARGPCPVLVRGHSPVLDGVRGIAILLVLFNHSLWEFSADFGAVDRAFYVLATSAWCGVDLFFVLSGFLITGILLDSKGQDHGGYFRNFYMRRTLRIFPLYYLVLMASFVVVPRVLPNLIGLAKQEAFGWPVFALYLQNIMIPLRGELPGPVLAPTWSLAVEEQYYLLWPLIVRFSSLKTLLRVCVGAIGLALAIRIWHVAQGHSFYFAFAPMWSRMDALAVGSLLAALARTDCDWSRCYRWMKWVGLVATGALVLLFVLTRGIDPRKATTSTLGFTLLALTFGWVMVYVLHQPRDSRVARALTGSWLLLLGKWSYCIYLVHHLVREVLFQYVWKLQVPVVGGSAILGAVVFMLVLTVISAAIAAVSWYGFERPILGLKRFFPR